MQPAPERFRKRRRLLGLIPMRGQVRRLSPSLLQLLVHVPRLARSRRQPVAILGQQQSVGDQPIHGLGHSRGPGITRCVAGFQGGPRIVGPQPLGFGLRERDHRTLNGE